MKKDEIFFSKDGLTSTSANYIANKCKEMYESIESTISSFNFLNYKIQLIGYEAASVNDGMTKDELGAITAKIEKIGKCKALIAWLRESITARQNMIDEVTHTTLEEFCENNGIEFKNAPQMEHIINADDVLGAMSIKDRNLYYELESKCSNLGKVIHLRGYLNSAKKELHRRVNDPTVVSGEGRDLTIKTYTPSVDPQFVDDTFASLEELHRKYQAQLNGIKHKIDSEIDENRIKITAEYSKALDAYNDWHDAVMSKQNEWILSECKRIQELKIVIPDSLADIYNEVSSYGKC